MGILEHNWLELEMLVSSTLGVLRPGPRQPRGPAPQRLPILHQVASLGPEQIVGWLPRGTL